MNDDYSTVRSAVLALYQIVLFPNEYFWWMRDKDADY